MQIIFFFLIYVSYVTVMFVNVMPFFYHQSGVWNHYEPVLGSKIGSTHSTYSAAGLEAGNSHVRGVGVVPYLYQQLPLNIG